jgi:hypothetical protein
MRVPLEIEEASFRDIGDPLLRHVREITADPEAVAVVIMPELIFGGPERLLHNQRALHQAAVAIRAAGDPHERPVPPGVETLYERERSRRGAGRRA